MLRPNAIAVLVSVAASVIASVAAAEPLDKQSCASLQSERTRLLNTDMQAALDQGPDWVKKHLTEEAIGRVRHFLSVEEQIQFRCRGGGVARSEAKPTDAKPADAKPADAEPANATDANATVPLPDRKPAPPSAARDDGKPSQALANSDKTPPGKAKATR